MGKPEVRMVDDSAPNVYGLEIEEKLFWEAYVMQKDCHRPEGSEWDTGTKYLLNFMLLNLRALQGVNSTHVWGPPARTGYTLYQKSSSSAMDARTLVMACEEGENVRLVVD